MKTAAAGGEKEVHDRATVIEGDSQEDSGRRRTMPVMGGWHRLGRKVSALTVLGVVLTGCQPRDTVDKDLYIAELEAQVMQLEGDLNAAYQEVSRLSGNLTSQVANLQTSMADLNLRILDLPAATDVPGAIREVEASMSVAMQRLNEVRTTTGTLAEYLE